MNPQKQHTLPEGWEMKKLGTISKVSSGGTPNRDISKYWNGNIPWITTSLIDLKKITFAEEFISEEGLANSSAKIYSAGTIIMAMYGQGQTRGKVAMLEIEATTNQACAAIVTNELAVDTNYLFQNLTARYYEIRNLSNAGTQENLNGEVIKSIPIPLPPLAEQRRIAAVLGTWDTGIEQTGELLNALRARHRALMHQLLTGKVRLPGFGGEWRSVKLGEVFKERNQSGYNNLPLLSITAEKGVINRDELEKRDTSNEDKSKYKRICVGDIGYNTMRMWQGRSAVSSLEGIVSPAYTIVTPKEGTDVQYMGYLFKLPEMIHRFYRNSQGLVDDTLNCKFPEFAKVRVAIPSTIQEQHAIAQVLEASLKEIQQQEAKLEALREQKRGLMQCLLTGRVRVPAA